MLTSTERKEERTETLNELSDLLFVVQEKGQRLALETHEKNYDQVQELNVLLHQLRAKLQLLKSSG